MMSELACRIELWESLFSKYEEADSSDVYLVKENLWENVQEEDKRQYISKDIKKRIDSLWKYNSRLALRNLQDKKKNKDDSKMTENTGKDCGSFASDETKHASMKYSSCDCNSYECDVDVQAAEDIQHSKKKFLTALCKASMFDVCEIQHRRERVRCAFGQRGAEHTSHKNGKKTVALFFPSHRSLPPKRSSFEENSSSAEGHRQSLVEETSSPDIKHTEKRKTICLDSSILRKEKNSERMAYRAIMKGRSLFDL